MSRSGYYEDLDTLELGRWRGQVAAASRGKRGQKFFRELVAALDALPEKKLVKNDLEKDGAVCALGAIARLRGIDPSKLDTHDWEDLGLTFDIAHQLAQETMYENDDRHAKTDEARWQHVRAWAAKQIVPTEVEMRGVQP